MTQVAYGPRQARSMDALEQATGTGWEGLEEMFAPRREQPIHNQPSDDVAMYLAQGLNSPKGREVIEWLMDITFRQPFRATGKSFEETALLTANRQGIEGVGEVILAAIRRGQELIDNQRG